MSSEERSTVICVLGPGRAGTSLTMRVLSAVGVDVGPPEGLIAPGAGTPKGPWERREIMLLNERLLRSQGGNWRRPPVPEPGWETDALLEGEREEAHALLGRTFAGQALWGWKDPRNSMTLPFWQQLLPEARYDVRYVICLRNPIDVATSLAPRRGVSADETFGLWLVYVASALANTAGRRRTFVFQDEHFEAREATAARLARFAGCEPPAPGGEAARAIDEFVEEGLWHHRTPAKQVLLDETVPGEVASLYLATELLRAELAVPGEPEPGLAERQDYVDAYAQRLLGEVARARRLNASSR